MIDVGILKCEGEVDGRECEWESRSIRIRVYEREEGVGVRRWG